MIEYLQNIILCNSGYSTHVHVTLVYVSTPNLLSIKFLSRVEINVIIKPFLTITILSIQFSTSIWISSKILYFYMCNIWIIHLFNALSSITLVIRVTQIRSGIIYHKLVFYIYIQLKLIYPYYLCFSLGGIYLHIIYIVLLSHKYVCRILKSSYIYYSMAPATDEHGLIALFTCYLYYVVIQLFVLFVFVHNTRACTCSIISYLLYMYMYNAYNIRMFKAVHVADIIHVHSYNCHILTGNLVGGGWMLLEGNQHQNLQNEINNSLGITLCILCSLFMNYYNIPYLVWFELSCIHYVYIIQSHYIPKGKHQGGDIFLHAPIGVFKVYRPWLIL